MRRRKTKSNNYNRHGTILVKTPTKVIGDRNTSTNLRYKLGRKLSYPAKKVLAAEHPKNFTCLK